MKVFQFNDKKREKKCETHKRRSGKTNLKLKNTSKDHEKRKLSKTVRKQYHKHKKSFDCRDKVTQMFKKGKSM